MKTTHIGSLPFLSTTEAIEFNRQLSLPCLPTLPLLSQDEWMLNQFLAGFMQEDHQLPFSCLEDFFNTYSDKVKVQLCGIQTLFNHLSTV